jgi:hypothetical protein
MPAKSTNYPLSVNGFAKLLAWEGLVLTFWHACSLEMLWGGIFEAN